MISTQTQATPGVAAVHACFHDGVVCLWAESASALLAHANDSGDGARAEGPAPHPFAAGEDLLRIVVPGGDETRFETRRMTLRLPARPGGRGVIPSDQLATELGRESHDPSEGVELGDFAVTALAVPYDGFRAHLDRLAEASERDGLVLGDSVAFFATLGLLAHHLLAQQRFVPMLYQDGGELMGGWMGWLGDAATADRARALAALMPPAARAAADDAKHEPWIILQSVLNGVIDAVARRVMLSEEMHDTIEGRDAADAHVAWLTGLLHATSGVPAGEAIRSEMTRRVRRWVGSLEDRGQSTTWRLLLRLNEPLDDLVKDVDGPPPDSVKWSLSLHLQNTEDPSVVVDAVDIFAVTRDSLTVQGYHLDSPQELLLAELGRASRFCPPLERALDEPEPIEVMLETGAAYDFLREIKPILIESGFGVETPSWWDTPTGRLGARLRIESDSLDDPGGAEAPGESTPPKLGLSSLVGYQWDIAVGGTTLTLHEFEQLAAKKAPLVRIDGRWVEIRPEDVEAAVKFIGANPGGEMELGEALRMAFGADAKKIGLHVLGVEATGWVSSILGGGEDESIRTTLPDITLPETFHGTLRPYQHRGLEWLSFMEQFGFGCCLADDMGLGKTVQLLALLTHERQAAKENGQLVVQPTLLIVPMSVVGNWLKEAKRFAPSLRVMIHHGLERLTGDALIEAAQDHDCVVTTFALANRDQEAAPEGPLGQGRRRRGPVHQEPRGQAVSRRSLVQRPAPHRAHRHARREPPQRALVDHGVPQPRDFSAPRATSASGSGSPSSATATGSAASSSGGSSARSFSGASRPTPRWSPTFPRSSRPASTAISRPSRPSSTSPASTACSTRSRRARASTDAGSSSRRSSSSSRSATTPRRCSRTSSRAAARRPTPPAAASAPACSRWSTRSSPRATAA
jgi:hypothetical protein